MKRLIAPLIISLLAAVVQLELYRSNWGERIESSALDLWYNLRGKVSTPTDVVIIGMDEASYRALDLPLNEAWPRNVHARLLQRLKESKAKRVVFDILFLGEGNSDHDSQFADALSLTPTVLGAEETVREHSTASGSYQLEELLTPPRSFTSQAYSLGLVGLPEDNGHVRRFLTEKGSVGKGLPTLAEAGAGVLTSGDLLPGRRDLINFYGPPGSITNYSYYQVIDSEKPLPLTLLENKIVYVGLLLRTYIGPAQKDVFQTPFFGSQRMFGTEIHATATANLIDKSWIRRGSAFWEGLILVVTSLICCLGIMLCRPQWGALIVFGGALLWSLAGYLLFLSNFLIPGATLVYLFLPTFLLLSTLYYYFVTRRAQMRMTSAFERYVSPQMAEQIAQNGALSLGGEKIWATALFTDIEEFTTITEEMPAEKVGAMLNSYFTEVAEEIFRYKGTLVKFIGDAVFVIWGHPVRINNHAELACRAALAIQESISRFNSKNIYPTLRTRIGIHTGPMVVGNLGSEKRFDYTAIGDAVNSANRIEGINKHFGSDIIVSETVRKETGGDFNFLPLGAVQLAGKNEALELHILSASPFAPDVLVSWGNGLQAFRNGSFEDAEKQFSLTAEREPRLKKAASVYLKELQSLKANRQGEAWRGEIKFLGK